MIISFDTVPPEWTSDHAKSLRDFLESPAGALALEWTLYNSPALPDGSEVNKTLVSTGEYKGYVAALKSLINLTKEQPKEVQEELNYPPLDDESAWAKL